VNAVMTATYWLVGRRIVEQEQRGSPRAGYGEQLLKKLASDLSNRFGRVSPSEICSRCGPSTSAGRFRRQHLRNRPTSNLASRCPGLTTSGCLRSGMRRAGRSMRRRRFSVAGRVASSIVRSSRSSTSEPPCRETRLRWHARARLPSRR
jgi:hypothetical protein